MNAAVVRGLALWLLMLACCAANAQQAEPVAAVPAESDKSYIVPALEIVGFDFLLNRFNRRFTGSSDYDVSIASIRRNLHGPWVVDNDPFKINQFAHPYQGSMYHGAGRASGLGYWESAALTFAGSALWEIAGEKTPPSKNDQVASGIAGSFLGEPLFRMAHLALKSGSSVPPAWREWVAGAISPPVGFNRLAFGSRFDGAFSDHDPAYYGRLHMGYTHVTRHDFVSLPGFKSNMAQVDFALDYGLPGRPGYTYSRPFDYFNIQALFSSANGVENLTTRGLLFGTDYAAGDNARGIWGLYGTYDYLAPQIFHVSTTSLSLGTTGQWWLSDTIAMQGTAMAGLGYAAASTTAGPVTDVSEYHYGTAPRVSLALRLIGGNSFSVDVSARRVSLGRITNRSAGSDDITRVDTSFTWRIKDHHAISVNYLWSHRNAQFPALAGRRQTLGTVGIYYTLLSKQGFGAVDWR
ncbi:MAG TPA: DUF3943 domain-containing protein [Ramlibacter sp.]|nr:DUF3943 domain-containing protein [Ramlibacter sp.]